MWQERATAPEVGPSSTWYNPLECQLPFAPNMTIYALYGVGKETERTYFYRRTQEAGDGGAGEDASAAVDLSMSMMENSTPVPRTTREDGAGKVGAVLREEGVENVGADEGGEICRLRCCEAIVHARCLSLLSLLTNMNFSCAD